MKLHLTGLLILSLLSALPAADADAQQRQTQLRGPKDATNQYSGAMYGPIDEQDTLWRIAERYRQNKSVSVYQVMLAIYELNPNAFEQQNLNLLVEGETLRLPSERFITRINKAQAQQRAEQDDEQFAQLLNQPQESNNIKPSVPLVNQSELSSTRNEIEQKINQLDEQQLRQFDELRNQFSASLDSVSALLDENRKLFDRVEQVNTDLMNLRQQVEGDVQSQMDEQLALQRQLLDMVRQEQAEREAEKNSGIMQTLTQPMSLIIGSGILTLLLAGGLAAWLLRRKQAEPQPEAAQATTSPVAETINDDVDDLSTSLISGLDDDTAELSDDALFNDDELLDDVLAGELDESLDSGSEVFSDIDDDMLVPDGDQIFEDGTAELGQDELDSLFDDDELSDTALGSSDLDEDVLDGIDLADDNSDEEDDLSQQAFTDESDVQAELASTDATEDDFQVSTEDAAQNEPEAPAVPASFNAVEADEKPEISIDELLEAEQGKAESLTGSSHVDDDMLDKLDKEINEQNEELDRLADNILDEIDQLELMGGLPDIDDDELDDDIAPSQSSPSPQSIQNLDALAGELDSVDIDDVELDASDLLADELLAELEAEGVVDDVSGHEPVNLPVPESSAQDEDNSTAGFDDPLGDELLAELSAEQDDEQEQLDALSDELLAELGIDDETPAASASDVQVDAQSDELDDELTSELLAELEQGIEAQEPVSGQQETDDDELDIDALIAAQQADDSSDTIDSSESGEQSEEIHGQEIHGEIHGQSLDELGEDASGQSLDSSVKQGDEPESLETSDDIPEEEVSGQPLDELSEEALGQSLDSSVEQGDEPESLETSDDIPEEEVSGQPLDELSEQAPGQSLDSSVERGDEPESLETSDDIPEALNLDDDANSDDAIAEAFNIDESDNPLEHNALSTPETDDRLSEADEPVAETGEPDAPQDEDDFAALADELLESIGQSPEDSLNELSEEFTAETTGQSLDDSDKEGDESALSEESDGIPEAFNIDESDNPLEHNELSAPETDDRLSEADEPVAETSKPDAPQEEDDFAALADELLETTGQSREDSDKEGDEPALSEESDDIFEALNLDDDANPDDAIAEAFSIDESDNPIEHNALSTPETDDRLSEVDEPVAETSEPYAPQEEDDFAALADELLETTGQSREDSDKEGGEPALSESLDDIPEALNLDDDANSDDAIAEAFSIDESDNPIEHNELSTPETDDRLSEVDEPVAETSEPYAPQEEDDFAALADELLETTGQSREDSDKEGDEPALSEESDDIFEALNLDDDANSDDTIAEAFNIDESDNPLEHNALSTPETDDRLSEADESLADVSESDAPQEDDFAALADELLDAGDRDHSDLTQQDETSGYESPENINEETLSAEQLEDEFAALADELMSAPDGVQNSPNAFDSFSEEELEAEFAGEPSLELDDDESLPDSAVNLSADSSASESILASESSDDTFLDDALAEFDQKMMDDIPSFSQMDDQQTSDFDDSILDFSEDDIDAFQLEQEQDGVIPPIGNDTVAEDDIDELDDVPGLDDWLSGNKSEDKNILDELESSDFDALLDGMDAEEKAESRVGQKSDANDFKLQNPDLDLAALLSDPDAEKSEQNEFLDVETLLDESMQDGGTFEEMPLDLDVSLSDFSGVSDDMDMIDIDKDAGQSANLDLARVYLEMDDMSSAKELLEEVLQQGSDEQKKEANHLLESLA
ncbi:FimV/HubP family polar landmark protein [Salinimonas lutimaris]|uniref:FimV/HubP family polar landmark protein n=1 Tax=Salinimonas lutimaris TaxID=914153 RepID=UPI0010C0A647|nr:FimV/HubP family polar landmark protein [Salinimonas lutimaris]